MAREFAGCERGHHRLARACRCDCLTPRPPFRRPRFGVTLAGARRQARRPRSRRPPSGNGATRPVQHAAGATREAAAMKSLNDLFLHFLKDMYYAEQQTMRSLPQMVAAAQGEALKKALDAQAQATRNHVAQLEKVFESVGKRPEGATCEALLGMVKEAEDLLKETGQAGPVQDAGVIASLQAMHHYAIARYGALLAWA